MRVELSPAAARVLSSVLEEQTGQQLSVGRRWRIEASLGPMLCRFGVSTIDGLAGLIATRRDGPLARDVAEALLNNETYFFRDSAAFGGALSQAIAALAQRRAGRGLRIWSAGCSTGQEAYSVAMLLEEDPRRAAVKAEILGTDISRPAVNRARAALYSQFEIQRGLAVRRMIQWFAPEGDAWRAKPALRSRVCFDVHHLFDPPPGQFDLVLCRNVLLYFSGSRRTAVFDRLAESLAPDGFLMLGAGETVIGQTDRFCADPDHRGIYRLRP